MPAGAALAAAISAAPRCPRAVAGASLVVPLLLLLLLAPTARAQGGTGGGSGGAAEETKYVAHVMPWFDRVTYRGVQGNHWCDPDYGNSYYESVFGRYSSSDPAVIRKQLLLMKAAGLDGVWIDLQVPEWLDAVRAIVTETASLGMNFAVVIDNYAQPKIVDLVKEDMQNFMEMPNYYRVFGRPVLPYYEHPWRWGSTTLPSWRARDGRRPYIIGTYSQHPDGNLPEGFDSVFFWHTPDTNWLETYYSSTDLPLKVGSIFHGWREAYADRKHTAPYFGYLQATLELAQKHKPYFAQLATWNDYTEGTMFEPAWLANVSSPHACADPRKSMWHDERKTCSQVADKPVFTNGGILPACLASTYESFAASGGDADAFSITCSGSGNKPCADVTDCSKPVGQLFGPAPSGCPSGNFSAYALLATLAQALAGLSEANATAKFEAIMDGWEPEPEPDAAMSAAVRSRRPPLHGCFALAASVLAGVAALRGS